MRADALLRQARRGVWLACVQQAQQAHAAAATAGFDAAVTAARKQHLTAASQAQQQAQAAAQAAWSQPGVAV